MIDVFITDPDAQVDVIAAPAAGAEQGIAFVFQDPVYSAKPPGP